MKAIVQHEYGGPEVLHLEEVPRPSPRNDEVLIEVKAAAVNAGDWHLMRADPFLIRFMMGGLLKPKKVKTLGFDVSGSVVEVGADVKELAPGDEVFGDLSDSGFGGFAEYCRAPEEALVLKPPGVSHEAAAAVPTAGTTALQGLRDHGALKRGQRVLINGASGGVGSFAVQLARLLGAEVTGVCSGEKAEMVRSLGASSVVDYKQEDVTRSDQRFDLILDVAAFRSITDYARILEPDGVYVMVGGATGRLFQSMLASTWSGITRGMKVKTFIAQTDRDDLLYLRDLLEKGDLNPVVDRTFALADTPDAIRYVEEGRVTGKTVVVP